MNIDYLRTYLELISSGSFSEAARRLSLTQPAVSFQIQKLERDLGVQLIDRMQKSIVMTQAGKRLYLFARQVEREHTRLMHDLEHLREDVAGSLAVGASTIPGEFLLPPILSEFKTLHPAIDIRVAVSDSIAVIEGVRNGTYEVGFCGLAPQGKDLESFRMAEDEIVLIVFPEHPFAGRQEVSFAEIADELLIFREETSGTRKSLESLLLGAGLDLRQFKPWLVLGTTQAVVSAVEAKAGIAFVSILAIKKSTALGLVKVVKVQGLTLKRGFFCVYRRERIASRLLTEFIAFTRGKAPQE